MLWAACCLGFFGFLRAGEFTVRSVSTGNDEAPLLLSDISIHCPTVVAVNVRCSKTDPFRVGVTLYLGATQDVVCPVKSLTSYLAIRSRVEGPLFIWKDGSPLTRTRFVSAVRETLSEIGFDPTLYSGHSFRIGAATTAAQAGIPDSTIQMLGRWKSSAYTRYIRTPRQRLTSVSSQLVNQL